MPAAANNQRIVGEPPATLKNSRRNATISRLGNKTINHRTIRILVADVDQGRDAPTAIATQSAMARLSVRLSTKAEVTVIDLVDMPVGSFLV
jgi:hypothetical protein